MKSSGFTVIWEEETGEKRSRGKVGMENRARWIAQALMTRETGTRVRWAEVWKGKNLVYRTEASDWC